MSPGGRRKYKDSEQEELIYNIFVFHCFSGRRKAQIYHHVISTALHASVCVCVCRAFPEGT